MRKWYEEKIIDCERKVKMLSRGLKLRMCEVYDIFGELWVLFVDILWDYDREGLLIIEWRC